MSTNKPLNTNAGCPVVDNQNVMTAVPRGPGAYDKFTVTRMS